jgi:hypothetical protein
VLQESAGNATSSGFTHYKQATFESDSMSEVTWIESNFTCSPLDLVPPPAAADEGNLVESIEDNWPFVVLVAGTLPPTGERTVLCALGNDRRACRHLRWPMLLSPACCTQQATPRMRAGLQPSDAAVLTLVGTLCMLRICTRWLHTGFAESANLRSCYSMGMPADMQCTMARLSMACQSALLSRYSPRHQYHAAGHHLEAKELQAEASPRAVGTIRIDSSWLKHTPKTGGGICKAQVRPRPRSVAQGQRFRPKAAKADPAQSEWVILLPFPRTASACSAIIP